ncbi:MAG: HEPN domain-containing protein [Prolixibacteraceae bacterium]|nr:HEPN domain-containing protein [Prolixibacteraceae bacterium]
MKASTRQWLEYALADLRSCEKILDDDFLTTIVAFHSQQAVEKCFKALIDENNIVIPRTHNLIRLHKIIENFLTQPIQINNLLVLDSVYINSRYPGEIGIIPSGKPTLEEAMELFEIAQNIYKMIKGNIP